MRGFGWDYPPGVIGSEYEIAGPDEERDDTRWCDRCEREVDRVIQSFRGECWFICSRCGGQTEIQVWTREDQKEWLSDTPDAWTVREERDW